LPVWR